MSSTKRYYEVPAPSSPSNRETQSAVTHGGLVTHAGACIEGEHVIVIDANAINDTNNTIEKVLASVRNTLEVDGARRRQRLPSAPE